MEYQVIRVGHVLCLLPGYYLGVQVKLYVSFWSVLQ